MFKDMGADTYLTAAGIASDWPTGRGCFVSADQKFVVWVGEEDHLRIMCMFKGTRLADVFNKLKGALAIVSGIEGLDFAFSSKCGNVTSCPSNLGTGMRASVHIALPNLTSDGTDTKAKAICSPLGLSVRGLGGEHTPIGADGTVDISPSSRFCIKESEIVAKLYQGLKSLKAAEDGASSSPAMAGPQNPLFAVFQQLDSDSSGSLDVREVRRALRALDLGASVDIDALMTKMDTDGDGQIDMGEWASNLPTDVYVAINNRLTDDGRIATYHPRSMEELEKQLSSLKIETKYHDKLKTMFNVYKSNPTNLSVKCFDLAYFAGLSSDLKDRHMACVNSGIENPDSGLGVYAMQPADYDDLEPFFSKVLKDYHKITTSDFKHESDWELGDDPLDLKLLGLPDLSMRVRVGRNLKAYPLPGAMSGADRKAMELKMTEAFDVLIGMPEFGGRYHSLTEGHRDYIDADKYKELVNAVR
jgi:hypothetical protein